MEQEAFFMSFALFSVLLFQSFHLTLPLAKNNLTNQNASL
ncbi:Hypothetical protein Ccan_04800 [Capnocytophaga canimorsus Cc5]|uniref:Uncharacterized protein n=1 Tax=Capnocytophaga canimorsus (strain 5) TaxID=860228 RepID=F9YS49_CAPCC|nr:Hypothetical protein Ccan_04800 [Capnocytophaga canimorsus Cc5]